MIQSYKNRNIPHNHKVEVYRNLNNNLFSIKCSTSNLVLGHGNNFIIRNATPTVRESARLKVVHEQRKNVHAYLTGHIELIEQSDTTYEVFDEIYYNPYTQNEFTLVSHNCSFGSGDILFKDEKAYVITGEQ